MRTLKALLCSFLFLPLWGGATFAQSGDEAITFFPSFQLGLGATDNVILVTPRQSGAFLRAQPRLQLELTVLDSLFVAVDLDISTKYFLSQSTRGLGNQVQAMARMEAAYFLSDEWELGLELTPSYRETQAPTYQVAIVHPTVAVAPNGSLRDTYSQLMARTYGRYAPGPWAFELGISLRRRPYSTRSFDILGNQFRSDFSERKLDSRITWRTDQSLRWAIKSTLEWRNYDERPTADAFGLPLSLSASPGPLTMRSHSHGLQAQWNAVGILFSSEASLRFEKDLLASAEDSSSVRLSQEMTLPSGAALIPLVNVSYERRAYANFRSDNVNSPASQPLRLDELIQIRFGLRYGLSPQADWIATFDYRKNSSNYYAQDYAENAIESAISVRF